MANRVAGNRGQAVDALQEARRGRLAEQGSEGTIGDLRPTPGSLSLDEGEGNRIALNLGIRIADVGPVDMDRHRPEEVAARIEDPQGSGVPDEEVVGGDRHRGEAEELVDGRIADVEDRRSRLSRPDMVHALPGGQGGLIALAGELAHEWGGIAELGQGCDL